MKTRDDERKIIRSLEKRFYLLGKLEILGRQF